jgi:hypothetical protein
MTGTSDAAGRNSGVIAEFRASHGRVGGYFAEATDTAAIPVRLQTCALEQT